MDAKGETDGMLEDRRPKANLDSKLCAVQSTDLQLGGVLVWG